MRIPRRRCSKVPLVLFDRYPGETVKERIFSIVRFISVNFGEQTIRFFLYPAGWNADDRWRNDDEKRDDKARDDGNNFRNIFEICVGTSELKNCLCNSLENL